MTTASDREKAAEIAEVLRQAGDGFVYFPGIPGMSRYAYIASALAAVRAETVERAREWLEDNVSVGVGYQMEKALAEVEQASKERR